MDSTVDGRKGKGRRKRLGNGNPWDGVGACTKKEREGRSQQRTDRCKQQKRLKPGKQRTGARNKGKEGETKRAERCQAPWSR